MRCEWTVWRECSVVVETVVVRAREGATLKVILGDIDSLLHTTAATAHPTAREVVVQVQALLIQQLSLAMPPVRMMVAADGLFSLLEAVTTWTMEGGCSIPV